MICALTNCVVYYLSAMKRKDIPVGVRASARAVKFLHASSRVKPSHSRWVEVVGSRLSIYDTEDKVVELARLQLSDAEVLRCSLGVRRSEGWEDDEHDSDSEDDLGDLASLAGAGRTVSKGVFVEEIRAFQWKKCGHFQGVFWNLDRKLPRICWLWDRRNTLPATLLKLRS
jgi:hypothetical protein